LTPARSAGLLLYRAGAGGVEVLLAHMGGPFWAAKDERAWSIPKGGVDDGEEPYAAARREFAEELGASPPDGPVVELGEIRQASGKRVVAWALEGDFDPAALVSNTFEQEWPPHSGRTERFPEVDRAAWFDLETARRKLVKGQVALLDALAERVLSPGARPSAS
jgi:predicted NUDIX family NTP pyrophosphohydrolase